MSRAKDPTGGDAVQSNRFAALDFVSSLQTAVFVMDLSGRILVWNGAAERLYGVPAASAMGRHLVALDLGQRIEGFRDLLARQPRAPEELTDVTLTMADGTRKTITLTVSPLSGSDGPIGTLVEADDRSDYARMREQISAVNEELRGANEQLQARVGDLEAAHETDRHKNEFLAMLAHELRNPLAPILSAMQIFRRYGGEEPVVQRAREIVERQVKHQARLLDDLLDVTRITRGTVPLHKGVVDFGAIVTEAIEASRPLAVARKHRLSVALPSESLPVEGDRTRLVQIVSNLLHNASKYTDPGGTIELTLSRSASVAVLSVRDSGVGIAREMLPRVFDLFTQLNPTLARSQGGLGVGLTVARSLVEAHGGTVTAHSEGPGRGSEFIVRLPLAADAANVTGERISIPAVTRTVLAIVDDPDLREALRVVLGVDGDRVEVAEDGLQGIEVALALRPDVAVIDLGLAGVDGYHVGERIRAFLDDHVAIIGLTTSADDATRQRAADAGFAELLVKPVTVDALTGTIAQLRRRAA